MQAFEPTCLAPIARVHHDTVKSQRLTALNNSLKKLSNAAAAALIFVKHTKGLDPEQVRILQSYIDSCIEIVSDRAMAINRDVKIISSCNYKWLMIQPIVVEDDLNHYNTFMTATYLQVSKDIAITCNMVEEYINKFEETVASMQSRNAHSHCSWYDTILQCIYAWIPYWRSK